MLVEECGEGRRGTCGRTEEKTNLNYYHRPTLLYAHRRVPLEHPRGVKFGLPLYSGNPIVKEWPGFP